MIQPIASIVCNTYNHEHYIADALESFLMQALDVPLEILVHDDASTDSTADIIRSYELRYPDIIKPIYQTENQYSKHVSITASIQIPRAQGKYIAFCEGDDYWTDPEKLSVQYRFMEAYPEYSACTHAYSMVDRDKHLISERHDFEADCMIPMKRLIGNQLEVPHFATLFARSDVLKKFRTPFLGVDANDFVLRVFCATQGDIYYQNRNMSAYRRFSEGSWTTRVGQDPQKMADSLKRYISFLTALNEMTGQKYQKDIENVIDERLFAFDLLENRYRDARKRKSFHCTPYKRKAYILIGCICPRFINRIRAKNIKMRKKS